MKTVLIVSNLYKPNIGGIENSLYSLAKSYLQLGYRPVICASDIHPSDVLLAEHEVEEGIEIYRYRINDYTGPLRLFKHWIHAVRLMKRLREQVKPDHVISRYHQSCLMLYLAGFRHIVYLIPGVVKFQNARHQLSQTAPSGMQWVKRKIDYLLNHFLQIQAFKRATNLFVFSQNMHNQVSAVYPQAKSKLAITKPGVDIQRFQPVSHQNKMSLRTQLGLATEKPVFLCIGRFVRAKGFDLAIEAMPSVQGAQLWIVGDGDEKARYLQDIQRLNMQDAIKVISPTGSPELLYAAADFFVMPSRYEPLGQTILEALSSGLPIVAFDKSAGVVTASEELLNDASVFYASETTGTSLANAMSKALALHSTDTYASSSATNRHQAELRFSWPGLCETLITPTMSDTLNEVHS